MGDQPKVYTTSEAADRLGITRHHVALLARALNVGRRFGRAWQFTDADLEILRQRRTTRGPEPKRDDTP